MTTRMVSSVTENSTPFRLCNGRGEPCDFVVGGAYREPRSARYADPWEHHVVPVRRRFFRFVRGLFRGRE